LPFKKTNKSYLVLLLDQLTNLIERFLNRHNRKIENLCLVSLKNGFMVREMQFVSA